MAFWFALPGTSFPDPGIAAPLHSASATPGVTYLMLAVIRSGILPCGIESGVRVSQGHSQPGLQGYEGTVS